MKIIPPTIQSKLKIVFKPIYRYRLVIFISLAAILYGYLVLQINQAVNVEPSADAVAASTKRTPRVDPELVEQLQQLEDNSVSVQALFNEARTNPFE